MRFSKDENPVLIAILLIVVIIAILLIVVIITILLIVVIIVKVLAKVWGAAIFRFR